jgi:hypothetical protein
MADVKDNKRGSFFLAVCLAVLTFYLASYLVLMNRKMPAQVSPGKAVFSSSFRFGHLYMETVNGTSTYYYGPTIANYIFLPVDYMLDHLRTNYVSPVE